MSRSEVNWLFIITAWVAMVLGFLEPVFFFLGALLAVGGVYLAILNLIGKD